jgi:hypothetical protein
MHFDAAERTPQKGGEMGWILETNTPTNRAIEGMGGEIKRCYRVYERHGPATVGAYIGAAYFFTSSAGFANPAISVGHIFSHTFDGIAPASVPGFIGAQLVGGDCPILVIRALYPAITPAEAADAVMPHHLEEQTSDGAVGQVA